MGVGKERERPIELGGPSLQAFAVAHELFRRVRNGYLPSVMMGAWQVWIDRKSGPE